MSWSYWGDYGRYNRYSNYGAGRWRRPYYSSFPGFSFGHNAYSGYGGYSSYGGGGYNDYWSNRWRGNDGRVERDDGRGGRNDGRGGRNDRRGGTDDGRGGRDQELEIKCVDLNEKRNRKQHRTEEYEENSLIIRRGQSFDVEFTLNREYKDDKDTISLELETGPEPSVAKSTMIQIPVKAEAKHDPNAWTAKYVKTGRKLTIRITPSSNAIVGEYGMTIETKTKGQKPKRKEIDNDKIIVIFNVFCKDDDCYVEDPQEQEEYVMNDMGYIWRGNARRNRARRWIFGQFEDPALRVALYLLDRCALPHRLRGSIVHVTRWISKMVNSNDDDGILSGNWSGNYSGGTSPLVWKGSIGILEKYWKQGKPDKPVKFGQCWVFSGVSTTLCRALGIPTRSVTNFKSAHDKDASNTIDKHFDENGEPLKHLDDSIWNYHVWNESWFKRSDLPAGYDGWQVHDATPQETSEGYFQCGPAPVAAVKRGDVFLPYDCGFVFGEVNGDIVNWTVTYYGELMATNKRTRAVGKQISTQSVYGGRRAVLDDITYNYKFREGSEEERLAAKRAHSFGSRKEEQIYRRPLREDVTMSEKFPPNVPVGNDVTAEVILENNSNQMRNLTIAFTNCLSFYTGIPVSDSRGMRKMEVQLRPNECFSLPCTIKANEYLKEILAGTSLMVSAVATVHQTRQKLFLEEDVDFETPDVRINVPRSARRGETFEFSVSIVNPLPIKLTQACFAYECKGITPKDGEVQISGPIKPGGEAKAQFKVEAKRTAEIEVSFSSREVADCDCEVTLVVE